MQHVMLHAKVLKNTAIATFSRVESTSQLYLMTLLFYSYVYNINLKLDL